MSYLEDEFGDVIRKARRGLGLAAEDVAARCRIAADRLMAFEAYRALPTHQEVAALARELRLGEAALQAAATKRWLPTPQDLDALPWGRIQRIVFPGMDSVGYLVEDDEAKAALFVDPGGLPAQVVRMCQAAKYELTACLLTHTHHDHIEALSELLQAFPNCPVVVHKAGAAHIAPWGARVIVTDGEARHVVGGVEFTSWHTPGHAPDCVTYHYKSVAFVGDALFAGSLGGSQKGAATYADVLNSGRRILELPANTALLPGHGPPTTVAQEAAHNPFLTSL